MQTEVENTFKYVATDPVTPPEPMDASPTPNIKKQRLESLLTCLYLIDHTGPVVVDGCQRINDVPAYIRSHMRILNNTDGKLFEAYFHNLIKLMAALLPEVTTRPEKSPEPRKKAFIGYTNPSVFTDQERRELFQSAPSNNTKCSSPRIEPPKTLNQLITNMKGKSNYHLI